MIEIMDNVSPITSEDLYLVCNDNNWFTGGTNQQYSKLFELNSSGASLEELALAIWLCSPRASRESIRKALEERAEGIR